MSNGRISTRLAYGHALAEAGKTNEKIVVLDADVSTCTMSCYFGEAFPQRFYNVGIAEANMVAMAAGMAATGLIPFVHSFAMFLAGRCFDQIRNSLAYPGLNVKVVGTHAGLSVGEDGATHQCLEDIGLMRSIPGMVVMCPADGNETRHALRAAIDHHGPVYLRLGRADQDMVTNERDYHFTLGKSIQLRAGKHVTIIATGLMVEQALKAATRLASEGIEARVLNMHTIKPIDRKAIIAAASETGAIVTAEEHNILAGLGSAVAEVVTETVPCPVLKVGTRDVFGRSGNVTALMEKYGLTADEIARQAKAALSMKG